MSDDKDKNCEQKEEGKTGDSCQNQDQSSAECNAVKDECKNENSEQKKDKDEVNSESGAKEENDKADKGELESEECCKK